MTPEQIRIGLGRLKAHFPNQKFDDLNTAAYSESLADLNWVDFVAGMKELVKVAEFFPTVAKIIEYTNEAARTRFQAKDREERQERLALQAAEDKIMDPKSEVHRVIQGPNHQRFLDMLSGKIQLPEPEWVARSRERKLKGAQ